MCPKVVSIYQQTFKNNDSSVYAQTFKFQRIYKTKPEQYFRIKCVSFTSLTSTARGVDVFMKGVEELCGKCNYQSVGANAASSSENNHFYLGTFSDTNAEYSPMEMLLNNIPLTPFQIYTVGSGVAGLFLVSFQIELLE